MGSELGLTGSEEARPKLDAVGIFWITFASTWTLLLAAAMAFLISKRNTASLKMRGLTLSFVAVGMLHMYWISVQLGYVLGPVTPGDGEYWIMGTWLPCGIALFHASNSRFLHVAKAQRRYAEQGRVRFQAPTLRCKSIVAFVRRLDYTTKMLALVFLGMFAQLFLTVLMWLISRKWHSSYGIPGTEVHGTSMQQKAEMGRGWEWWPGVFWQVFWSWIVAPYILWKSRGICDTHGWRVQTIACCLVSLHATPMWLIALYVPAMEKVNAYWIPPQWIAVSIMFTEIFTIFLPCWEVVRHQSLKQETLDSIAVWEKKNNSPGSGTKSLNSDSTAVASMARNDCKSTAHMSVKSSSDESIFTMGALEHVLERNPEPLQQFSALRDFSGENIAFLTSVAEWKSTTIPGYQGSRKSMSVTAAVQQHVDTPERQQERFNRALNIYVSFISTRDAEFPINISSHDLKALQAVFEGPARIMYGERFEMDAATPFDDQMRPGSSASNSNKSAAGSSEKAIVRTEAEGNGSDDDSEVALADRVRYVGEIPEGFDGTVFDAAEGSIKYLVLTNTWPKFVRDRRMSMDSFDSMESGNTLVVQSVEGSKKGR